MLVFVDDACGVADNEWVRAVHNALIVVGGWQLTEKILQTVESRALLVVGLDNGPRRIGGVGVEQHGLFSFGIVVPLSMSTGLSFHCFNGSVLRAMRQLVSHDMCQICPHPDTSSIIRDVCFQPLSKILQIFNF